MKNLLFLLTLTIPLISISQQQVVSEDIEITEDFYTINLNSRYTVYLKQSNETKIQVRALKEVMDISKFVVEDGALNINIKKDERNESIWEQIDDIKIAPKLDVFISMQDIKSLNVYGNGKLITENSISSKDLSLTLSGSGTLNVDIKGENLSIINSGGGLMKLHGYANHADISLSGYGSLEAYKLDLKTATAKVSGSGDMEITVSNNLDGYVYGVGNIRFKGNTQKVTKKEYGLGKVERTY